MSPTASRRVKTLPSTRNLKSSVSSPKELKPASAQIAKAPPMIMATQAIENRTVQFMTVGFLELEAGACPRVSSEARTLSAFDPLLFDVKGAKSLWPRLERARGFLRGYALAGEKTVAAVAAMTATRPPNDSSLSNADDASGSEHARLRSRHRLRPRIGVDYWGTHHLPSSLAVCAL